MDNFMDKLAEKYNAQDMIRANSQAETAQMQSLQDQVEAYEAVLQEMRKLNYKNTELTEKMYALVDASIEKVRTLEIEAKEGGVDTAEVSREMHAAVNEAVSEAISNMDETMARTLAESLQQQDHPEDDPEPPAAHDCVRLLPHLGIGLHFSTSVRSTAFTPSADAIALATARTPQTSVS